MIDGAVVIDASAVIALVMKPDRTGEEIAQRIAGHRLHAPVHLFVEAYNVLRRFRNMQLLSDAEARLAIHGLWTLRVDLWPLETTAERVWELGHSFSAYDGAYVALAERLDAPLITLHKRLARAPGTRCAIEVFG